jgi:DNA-binding MarR family transcriptional regulator
MSGTSASSKTSRSYPSEILAWARLLKGQKVLVERVQSDLAEADLPPLEWYDVLYELKTAPEKRLRFYELGDKILLSRSNLTRLVDRLEDKRLLRRENCSEDRRGLYAVITEAGEALLRKMWPVYQRSIQTHFADKLSARETEMLESVLGKLLA